MKLLIIICSNAFYINCCDNIKIFNDYMKLLDVEVDYCGVSSENDFHNYEHIIPFKYKIINSKHQISKICDFITDYKSVLDYDWYMKIRPEVVLLENINFDNLSENAVNARARVYHGPRKIKYGMSINGPGIWKNVGDCFYDKIEHDIILDDMLFIFHKNIVDMGAFDKFEPFGGSDNEWKQAKLYNDRNIPLNVIGIHFKETKYGNSSGDIHMNSE